MRFLLIHAKSLKYRTTKEVKIPIKDEANNNKKWYEFENVLVAFTSIEKEDEEDEEQIAIKGADELQEISRRVGSDKVLIYPYAHLFSEKLGKPKSAINILKLIEEKLNEKGVETHRAPFGWYKEFILHCLGHPLSESSRQVHL